MKKLSILLFSLIAAACSPILNVAMSEHRDWDFMKSVGGLTVGVQDKNPDWLIIRGDVSGLAQYSTKPTTINSALTVMDVRKNVEGTNIQVYVVTTLACEKYPDPKIYGVSIKGVKEGRYLVQYLNPDGSVVDLKEVTIN